MFFFSNFPFVAINNLSNLSITYHVYHSLCLLQARDQLTKNRHKKKTKKTSKTEGGSDSDTSTDDLPLSSIKSGVGTQGSVGSFSSDRYNTCTYFIQNQHDCSRKRN